MGDAGYRPLAAAPVPSTEVLNLVYTICVGPTPRADKPLATVQAKRSKSMDWPSGSIEHTVLQALAELGFANPVFRSQNLAEELDRKAA